MNNSAINEPWLQSWPAEDLESVSLCPVCGNEERKVLYNDLVDNVFRAASGKWMLWECLECKCAYLNPRPTLNSIGRAYETYYTHSVEDKREQPNQLGKLRLLRRSLANGYINYKYGTEYQPASRLGLVMATIFRSQREALDVQFRWLPKPVSGQRLLDIGCGNGGFLSMPRDAGWQVLGIDPDPNAVAAARELGLEVYTGTVDVLAESDSLFDAITISHVIEHVHDPQEMLSATYRMLRPGGKVFIDTPNIESLGHQLFGANWRGLETPRHLVLFSIEGLRRILKSSGFVDIEFKQRRSVSRSIYLRSLKLKNESQSIPQALSWILSLRARFPFRSTTHLEFITLLARKPK